MIIKRKSIFSGVEREVDLPVTEEQIKRWNDGELIQTVFPHLSTDEREFLKTGASAGEWNDIWGDE